MHPAEPRPDGNIALQAAGKLAEPSRLAADLQREADRLLLARYAPPAVVVSEQLDILQTKGHTGSYLELPAGKATLNLLKMARPGLLSELQGAIDEARTGGVMAVRTNVAVEEREGVTLTTIRVIPFKTPVQDQFVPFSSFIFSAESA